jgi:5'/3'-nucleotidase SurE
VPAVAVSQQADDGSFQFNDSGLTISFRLAAEAARLVRTVATQPPPARTVLNVNLPSADGTPRVVLTRPGRRFFAADVVKAVGGPGDERAFYPYGPPSDPPPPYDDHADTDFAALQAGCISVSLLAAGAADETSAARRSWFHGTFLMPQE